MVGGTHGFREDITDAHRFADGTDTAAGDNPRSGRCGLEQNLATAEFGVDFVGDGSVHDAHRLENFAGRFAGFLDGIRHLIRLAEAETDLTELVSADHKSREAEATAAFDDLGATVDKDDLFGKLIAIGIGERLALLTARTAATTATAVAATAAATKSAAAAKSSAALPTAAATLVAAGAGFWSRRGLGSWSFRCRRCDRCGFIF